MNVPLVKTLHLINDMIVAVTLFIKGKSSGVYLLCLQNIIISKTISQPL